MEWLSSELGVVVVTLIVAHRGKEMMASGMSRTLIPATREEGSWPWWLSGGDVEANNQEPRASFCLGDAPASLAAAPHMIVERTLCRRAGRWIQTVGLQTAQHRQRSLSTVALFCPVESTHLWRSLTELE